MSNRFQFTQSSAPSTPAKSPKNTFNQSHPSTTPAGPPPPPSSHGSLTPAGAPPAFGSSIFNQSAFDSPLARSDKQPLNFSEYTNFSPSPVKPAFNSRLPKTKTSSVGTGMFGRVTRPPARSGLSQELGLSTASYASDAVDLTQESEEEDDEHGYDDGRDSRISRGSRYDEEYSVDEEMHEDQDDRSSETEQSPAKSQRRPPQRRQDFATTSRSSVFDNSPEPTENGYDYRNSLMQSTRSRITHPAEPIYGKIAKDLANRAGVADITEADKVILETESLVSRLYSEDAAGSSSDDMLTTALSTIPKELISLWVQHDESIRLDSESVTAIGPGQKASKFASAQFLSSLLLMLHHPPIATSPNYASLSLNNNLALSIRSSHQTPSSSIPSVLLAWMYENHDPLPSQLAQVREHKPSASAHPHFWPTILNSLLRGKVLPVMNALEEAGWEHTPAEDGHTYNGQTLDNIRRVMNEAVSAISQCPGGQENWNVDSSDWTLFRLKVQQALENLKMFAEGRNELPDVRKVTGNSLAATTRRAKSQVPWSIYQRLTTLYNLMLGDTLAIIETSQDWCEATIGLVLWGAASEIEQSSAERLADAFYTATESDEFEVNPLSIAEVGLAAIFEGEVKQVILLLESCSETIAAAVVEIASLGGWLPKTETQNLISMFDTDDMDVLGLEGSPEKSRDIKDEVLITYARELFHKGAMSYTRADRKKVSREGWELAIQILGRLNSSERSEEEVDQILEDFPLDSSKVIDKMWGILNYLELNGQAEKIAEKYADSLADSTRRYGEALWYYALAHRPKKVKDVLDLLISYSLIHSTAWPPPSELDEYLSTIISSPGAEIAKLANIDQEAAELLRNKLSGYATLRTYYNLRDYNLNPQSQFKHLRPKARNDQALSCLLAVLSSSDDSIRGGIYDPSRDAVVSVDFLLALLGECLPFLTCPSPTLTSLQTFTILKTLEDLASIPPTLNSSIESFFQTVVASTPGGLKGSNPMDLLQKSTNMSGSQESFSLVGGSMMASQFQKSLGATKVRKGDIKRVWDWRDGLEAGVTGGDVIKMLRLGIAKILAKVDLQWS